MIFGDEDDLRKKIQKIFIHLDNRRCMLRGIVPWAKVYDINRPRFFRGHLRNFDRKWKASGLERRFPSGAIHANDDRRIEAVCSTPSHCKQMQKALPALNLEMSAVKQTLELEMTQLHEALSTVTSLLQKMNARSQNALQDLSSESTDSQTESDTKVTENVKTRQE